MLFSGSNPAHRPQLWWKLGQLCSACRLTRSSWSSKLLTFHILPSWFLSTTKFAYLHQMIEQCQPDFGTGTSVGLESWVYLNSIDILWVVGEHPQKLPCRYAADGQPCWGDDESSSGRKRISNIFDLFHLFHISTLRSMNAWLLTGQDDAGSRRNHNLHVLLHSNTLRKSG